jgi:hypothetical protein
MIKALILTITALLLPRFGPATQAAAPQNAPGVRDPTTVLHYTHPADMAVKDASCTRRALSRT